MPDTLIEYHVTFLNLPLEVDAEELRETIDEYISPILERFAFRECALERCQKTFIPSNKNRNRHRFCSNSHRVIACRERKQLINK